jgi:hypothetical protein
MQTNPICPRDIGASGTDRAKQSQFSPIVSRGGRGYNAGRPDIVKLGT